MVQGKQPVLAHLLSWCSCFPLTKCLGKFDTLCLSPPPPNKKGCGSEGVKVLLKGRQEIFMCTKAPADAQPTWRWGRCHCSVKVRTQHANHTTLTSPLAARSAQDTAALMLTGAAQRVPPSATRTVGSRETGERKNQHPAFWSVAFLEKKKKKNHGNAHLSYMWSNPGYL